MANPSTYLQSPFSSLAPQACIADTSLPTFSGIQSITPNQDGSFTFAWNAATSTKTPVRYELYAALGTLNAAALFVTANKVAIAPGALTAFKVFLLRDQLTPFLPGQTYTFGIRAVDALNFNDTNTVVVTSAAAYVGYNSLAGAVWDQLKSNHNVSGSFGQNLDAQVSLTQTEATALSQYNAIIAAIGGVDTDIGTLLTIVDAIQTIVDKFQFDGSNFVKANAEVVSDKTGYDLLTSTVNAIAGMVWDELLANHDTAGTFGANAQNPPLNPTQIAAAVWNALIEDYDLSGSFGKTVQAGGIDPTEVAAAVWNALLTDYDLAGSFGQNAQTPSLNPTQVAQAVWNALAASYDESGSMGELLNDAGAPAAPNLVGIKVLTGRVVNVDQLKGKIINPPILRGRVFCNGG